MSLFTGVSVVADGKLSTTSSFDADTDSGYHLLMVKDYSRTVRETSNGEAIIGGPFMVGGWQWSIWYYPNGDDPTCTDFISLYVCLGDVGTKEVVKVHCVFSFIDQVEYQTPMFISGTKPQSLSNEDLGCGWSMFMKRDALERSTFLKDDCFTIRCDIVVWKESNTQDIGGTMLEAGQDLGCLLQNKVGADVTFEVSGEMFTAHRCVLAARSTVFMAQLFGPMKEGTTSSVIQIKDIEPKLFRALIGFIYTGLFPEMDDDNNIDKAEVVEEGQDVEYVMWLQDLFVAADKYDLQRLKFLCETNLSEYICVSSVSSTLALAEKHHCHRLRETCLKFILVQSPPCLEKIMATDDWEHISTTYPSVLNKLITKLASNQKKYKKRKR